jgi:dolichol kinase
MFLPSSFLVILNEKKKLKIKEPTLEENNASQSQVLPLKYDIYRKLTHLVVLGIILFYFTLGFWIQTLFIYILDFLPTIVSEVFFSLFLIEDNIMIFTQYLVVFLVGISLIGLLTADFIRILKPQIYPLKPINQLLRLKELNYRLGPQISMAIGCFSIIILFGLFQPTGPLIICTSMVMAIFGDMASNLIGRIFGRKKIRKSNKTFEGLIAGILVAFFTGLVFLMMLNELFVIYPVNFFFYPLIGALLIGLIDYLDLEIDDNLLNPIVVSSVLFFISLFQYNF